MKNIGLKSILPHLMALLICQTSLAVLWAPMTLSAQAIDSTNVSKEKLLAQRIVAQDTDEKRMLEVEGQPALVNVELFAALMDEADKLNRDRKSDEARALYLFGRKIAERVGDLKFVGRFLMKAGNLTPDLTEQAGMYTQVTIIFEKLGDEKSLAGVLGRLGNNNTIRGDYRTARQLHERALALRRRLNDQGGIAISLSNIGLVDQRQGDLEAAKQKFTESVAILGSLGDKNSVGIDSYNLGNVLLQLGDYMGAMREYSKSLAIFEELKADGGIEGVATNIANLYIEQGNAEIARKYLDRASLIADKTGATIPNYALGSYGDSYVLDSNFPKALEFYEKLLMAKEKGENKEDIAETLIDIAGVYIGQSKPVEAFAFFDRAARLGEETKSDLLSSIALTGLAEASLLQGDFAAALQYSNQAADHTQKVQASGDLWKLYTVKARSHIALRQYAEARTALNRAVTEIEERRNNIAGGQQEKLKYLADRLMPYRLLAELAALEGENSGVFESIEKARARALIEAIGESRRTITSTVALEDVRKEQDLRNDLVSLQTQLKNTASSKRTDRSQLSELESRLNTKRLEFEDFRVQLFARYPRLGTARGEMRPATVDEVSTLLPDARSAVLEFSVGESKALLLLITKGATQKASLSVFTLDLKNIDLGGTVGTYRAKLASGDLDFQKVSRELYDLLLKPAQAQLAGKTNIIIVPDGPLWDLPFQALMDGRGKYLVEKAAISYAPSLTALREMSKRGKRRNASAGMELLAFGNPIVGEQTKERVQRVFMSEKLEPLPESERLVNELGKMYGAGRSRVLTGTAAREEIAKSESPKYRIVQFATHGVLNNTSPMYSHLVLAQPNKESGEDGLLEAWELKDMNLNADMVILSACETARGKVSRGEGMIGMTWAAFIAGAPTTVASQWKVESRSTTELMLEFHRQLLKGKVSKAEAMRQAALKLKRTKEFSHPSYWAGFVVVGDAN